MSRCRWSCDQSDISYSLDIYISEMIRLSDIISTESRKPRVYIRQDSSILGQLWRWSIHPTEYGCHHPMVIQSMYPFVAVVGQDILTTISTMPPGVTDIGPVPRATQLWPRRIRWRRSSTYTSNAGWYIWALSSTTLVKPNQAKQRGVRTDLNILCHV